MKKILIKAMIVTLIVFGMPLFTTLLLSRNKNDSHKKYTDFSIYYELNGNKTRLTFDEYLIGVVAANMPAGYEMEALKAQAVIARTYALYNISLLTEREPGKTSFSTSELGLSYIGLDALSNYWSSDHYREYFSKLENAVYGTKDEVITYQKELILPVFFNTGSGYTRNASEAWGIAVPYLVSVSSTQDVTSMNYLTIEEFSVSDLISRLEQYYGDLSLSEDDFFEQVSVMSRDSAGYVTKINLGNLSASGEEFAKVLDLASNHFTIEEYEGKARIICNGYGHGIGLSQYGANAMAEKSKSYKEILAHYYSGTTLTDLK
jgi:stage II sporulation protein D